MSIRYLPKSNVIKTPNTGKAGGSQTFTPAQVKAAQGVPYKGSSGGGGSKSSGESESSSSSSYGTGSVDYPWLLDEIKKWTSGGYDMPDSVKSAMINNVRSRLYGEAYGEDYNPDTSSLREGGRYGGMYKTMLQDMNRRGLFQSGLATEEQGKINQAVMKDLSSAQQQYDTLQYNTNLSNRQFGVGAGLGYRSGDISLAAQSLQAKLAQDAINATAEQSELDRELQKYLAQYQTSAANSAAGSSALGSLLGTGGSIAMMKIFFGCFSQETPVVLLDEDEEEMTVTISDVIVGDKIKTDDGFKTVTGVFSYEKKNLMSVNGIRCTNHPFIKANGELIESESLCEGDELYGDVIVDEVLTEAGKDYVFNLEVEGHKFYVGNMLVHDGREVK